MSSNAVSIGQAALVFHDASRLLDSALAVAALSYEAAEADRAVLDPRVHAARPHHGQVEVARRLRELLGDAPPRRAPRRSVHDPFVFRCVPQVEGTLLDALDRLGSVLAVEINVAGENALMLPGDGVALPNGNFHAGVLTLALDALRGAMAQSASLVAARVSALLDPEVTGLASQLAQDPGPDSGAMILEYTAHAAAAEVRSLAATAASQTTSVQSGIESHANFAGHSARRTSDALARMAVAVSAELVLAVRALRLRGRAPAGPAWAPCSRPPPRAWTRTWPTGRCPATSRRRGCCCSTTRCGWRPSRPRTRRVRTVTPDVRLTDRRRVAALRDMGLLTDTPEEAYDRFTRLAAAIVEAPIALFTVITDEEQFFRSQVGLPEPVATTRRTPLSHSFCQYVILSSAPLRVEDARVHPVVKGNPAIEELNAIAYLGRAADHPPRGDARLAVRGRPRAARLDRPRPVGAARPRGRDGDRGRAAQDHPRGRGTGLQTRGRAARRQEGAHRVSEQTKPTSILRPLVEELAERRERAKLGGGEERIARQHAAEKLTARERIDLLIDPGTFTELGIHAGIHHSVRGLEDKEAPADGVITGYGKVDGRMVAVAAYDFTVMAGSMGMTGEMKVARLRELALTKRIPFVWLLDSAGARIQEAVGSLFAGSGHLFREEVIASGVIPQVAALMGPCAAGTAYIPGLADFVPMVKGRGSMALAGPHLVRAAVGEDVTQEELGGSRVHCRKSGVGDLEVADDEECIARIRQYLSYFPSHCEQAPPLRPAGDPIDRMDEELLDVLPESNRKPYDMYEVIRRIVDDGEWLDLKPQWAKTIITASRAWAGGRSGSSPTSPSSSAASSTTTPPTRPRAS